MILLISLLAGCDNPADLRTGKEYYEYYCAACHGVDGQRRFLKGVPALAETELSVTKMRAHMRGQWRSRKDQSRMPTFEQLSTAELNKISAYILRELKQNQGGH